MSALSCVMPDETLNYWADQFLQAQLRDQMSFERFLNLPRPTRVRLLKRAAQIEQARREQERDLPATATHHGPVLIDRIKASLKRRRRPWFHRQR